MIFSAKYTFNCLDSMLRLPALILLFCAALSPGFAASSSSTLLSEQEFFSDIPSVASVTRLPQLKSETPAAVTVIDSDMIKASGARNIADVLRLVPGFQVAYPRGDKPAVTYHGLGDEYTRRMQILVDGRSVYGALFGHVSWSTQAIALEDIERIEIVRGPNTVSYGANAFLGTINIITRHALQSQGSTVKLSTGNHDINNAYFRHSGDFKLGNARATLGYESADGLDRLPDDYKSLFLNLRGDIQFGTKDSMLIQSGVSRAQPTEGYNGSIFAPPTESEYYAHFEQLRWLHQLTNANEISLQVYHNYRNVKFQYVTDPLPLGPPFGTIEIPVNYNGTAHQYGIEAHHVFNTTSNLRGVWGFGFRDERVNSAAFFHQTQSESTYSSRLFSNLEWRLSENLMSNLGFMREYTDITGADFSPRIALNYHVSPENTLRVVYSNARRIPSLFEEYGDFRYTYQNQLLDHIYNAQGGLHSESMTSFELGYYGQSHRLNMSLDIRLYRDRISRIISQHIVDANDLSDNLALSYRNEGKIIVNGIDMEFTYRPTPSSRVYSTIAYMEASADTTADDSFIDREDLVNSVPKYSGSLLLLHTLLKHWHVSAGFYWVDNMIWLDARDEVDSYTRLDLRLARNLDVGIGKGEIALTVQNADGRYQDFYNNQYFNRHVFLTCQLEF